MKEPVDRAVIIEAGERTPDEWLRMGDACLNGKGGLKDYEQAAFCFRQAEVLGDSDAAVRLADLAAEGKGVVAGGDVADASTLCKDDAFPTVRPYARTALMNNPDRCPSCGATVFQAHSHPDGGYVCVREEGGCGGRLYIPIEEHGLAAGFAVQPYKERQEPDVYSYFGRCMHVVKYDNDLSDDAKENLIDEAIMRLRECCVVERLLGDCAVENVLVLPAPSSVNRRVRLAHSLAKGLAADRFEYAEPLRKHSGTESKNREQGAELADGEITCTRRLDGRTVLLIDDTYGEGATLRACIRALKRSGAGDIYFLSLCKNIYGGMKGRR